MDRMPLILDHELAYGLFCGVDTRNVSAAAHAVEAIEKALFGPGPEDGTTGELLGRVAALFGGDFESFQRNDTPYHDIEHTLQATLCWCQLFAGFHRRETTLPVTRKQYRVGLMAILLHDIGYLKEEGDEQGTGAKFTYIHERRSCEMANVWLHASGWAQEEISSVQRMISCTGPRATIGVIPFRDDLERVLGQMVCTADYLGQLSDPRYVEKIPALYLEFLESDTHRGIPPDRRAFRSLADLYACTQRFWRNEVQRRLEDECAGLYHLLTEPGPAGVNRYLAAVAENLREVAARAGSTAFTQADAPDKEARA